MAKTLEERKKIVEGILNSGGMFGVGGCIVDGSVANREVGGVVTGWKFRLDNLSYRGVWLSTIEGLTVKLDGEEIPHDHMMIELKGVKYPLSTLEGHTEVFWDAKEECNVIIYCIGGLSKGTHRIEATILKRGDFGHSYGEGVQGYEDAREFHTPSVMTSDIEVTI
ncbi:MAG: hypothetical protein J6P87_03050 [Lachnospiraceae bacterium]|nr:hypothetical protein [Lachnospiraceae bacterium]